MPEEMKLETDEPRCGSSECSPDLYRQRRLRESEASRSESSSCCSDESTTSHKSNGTEPVEVIPTRTLKTSVPKPAANPLQFIKIGPSDLYRSAQQHLHKVSPVEKPKTEIKDEIEDWQSNLDNWKCSRRKQQEHIIERVVEVKKLELEEHDRNRKRTKTFSEMMEERTSKGRKLSLPVFTGQDADDLSDLGISSNKSGTPSSSPIAEECDEKKDRVRRGQTWPALEGESPCADSAAAAAAAAKSARNDEVTYESAILSYETRMKCLASSGDAGENKSASAPPLRLVGGPKKYAGRRGSAAKIEAKLDELERAKNRSASQPDVSVAEVDKKTLGIPKVNIFARKEIFERRPDEATGAVKCGRAPLADQGPRVRTVKERLSRLEKRVEEASKTKSGAPPLVDVRVRDRLASISEKTGTCPQAAASPTSAEAAAVRSPCDDDAGRPFRSLSELGNGAATRTRPEVAHGGAEQPPAAPIAAAAATSARNRERSCSGRSSSSENYENVAHRRRAGHHFHHRSLDSLRGRDSPNGFCFERVQSLECVDCCRDYTASVLSGDTDREDSGIHTADVSSSVSQADDFDLHADASVDADVKASPMAPVAAAVAISDGVAAGPADAAPKSSRGGCRSSADDDTRADDCAADDRRLSATESERAELPDKAPAADTSSSGGPLSNAECSPDGRPSPPRSPRSPRSPRVASVRQERGHLDLPDRTYEGDVADALRPRPDEGDESQADGCASGPTKRRQPQPATGVAAPIGCGRISSLTQLWRDANSEVYVTDGYGFGETLRPNEGRCEKDAALVGDLVEMSRVVEGESSVSEPSPGLRPTAPPVPHETAAVPSTAVFAFEPSAAVEPPKEKPPPPPRVDNSDDEEDTVVDSPNLRRVDSTRRIKKEIRLKRSSFLGIEGYDDDSYLEPELKSVKRPPDMSIFLQEERRLEKLLYRQSICSESDSTQGESRDSGVELDRNLMDEHSWITDDAHSRQNSEIYANVSVTSEEDEIIRKEREILEILEVEERRNYETDNKRDYSDLGERLLLKLKELERWKNDCCCNEEAENGMRDCDAAEARTRIRTEYEKTEMGSESVRREPRPIPDERRPHSDSATLRHKKQRARGRSLQDVTDGDWCGANGGGSLRYEEERPRERHYQHRASMPNIRQEPTAAPSLYGRVPAPAPATAPVAPGKAARPTLGRADNEQPASPHQMTKQTLQALSAVPRSKIVATDSWVLCKKKQPKPEAYNYQHWLIQEAEHRRITEYEYHRRHGHEKNGRRSCAKPAAEFCDGAASLPANEATRLDSDGRWPAHQPARSPRAHPQMLPSHRNHDRSSVDGAKKAAKSRCKPLPDSVIQTLTRRVQHRLNGTDVVDNPRRRDNHSNTSTANQQEKMLSVSGKKKCSHCGEELGRGAAMIIESLRLFYHIDCFKCCVCCVQLGDGLMGTDVRVRNSKLHCHSCYSNDEGLKFSCV